MSGRNEFQQNTPQWATKSYSGNDFEFIKKCTQLNEVNSTEFEIK